MTPTHLNRLALARYREQARESMSQQQLRDLAIEVLEKNGLEDSNGGDGE